jgi:signal transduction histidine kinase
MKTVDHDDLNRAIAKARTVLSVLALASWYIDPADGGWFFIDKTSLIILSLHLVYSLAVLVLIDRRIEAKRLPDICTALDVAFAAAVTVITEGATSPSSLFFVFAIVAVDSRTDFRAPTMVAICGGLVYFLLLAVFVPEYRMRAAYLTIIGYLIGFIGAQRARFEARVRDLETAAERHAIARTLHDGYVQVLAGVNLRLETCRALMNSRHGDEALAKITDVQKEVAREYDAVRAYTRSLAEVEQIPESAAVRPFAVETFCEVTANFAGRASILEQVLEIVLEGVRNSWQHGEAARAAINISAGDHRVRIAMDDDGVGFRNSAQPPWSIASRVAEYGGQLKIRGGERHGAHLEIEIPAA